MMVFPETYRTKKYPQQSLLMDGMEQTLFIASGLRKVVQMYLDLAEVLATDVVRIRTYVRETPAGAYVKWGDMIYPDPSDLDITKPMMYFRELPVADSLKLTIQQTAGVMRTVTYTRIEEKRP